MPNPTNHTLGKRQRHSWWPLEKRNIEVLFPPPQPWPSEKDRVIHQFGNDERLIIKNHVISEVPNGSCSYYPPDLPPSIGVPRGSQGEVLKKVLHRIAVQSSNILDPGIKFPPQRHYFMTIEKKVGCRFNLTLAEGAEVIWKDNMPPNKVFLRWKPIPEKSPTTHTK